MEELQSFRSKSRFFWLKLGSVVELAESDLCEKMPFSILSHLWGSEWEANRYHFLSFPIVVCSLPLSNSNVLRTTRTNSSSSDKQFIAIPRGKAKRLVRSMWSFPRCNGLCYNSAWVKAPWDGNVCCSFTSMARTVHRFRRKVFGGKKPTNPTFLRIFLSKYEGENSHGFLSTLSIQLGELIPRPVGISSLFLDLRCVLVFQWSFLSLWWILWKKGIHLRLYDIRMRPMSH